MANGNHSCSSSALSAATSLSSSSSASTRPGVGPAAAHAPSASSSSSSSSSKSSREVVTIDNEENPDFLPDSTSTQSWACTVPTRREIVARKIEVFGDGNHNYYSSSSDGYDWMDPGKLISKYTMEYILHRNLQPGTAVGHKMMMYLRKSAEAYCCAIVERFFDAKSGVVLLDLNKMEGQKEMQEKNTEAMRSAIASTGDTFSSNDQFRKQHMAEVALRGGFVPNEDGSNTNT